MAGCVHALVIFGVLIQCGGAVRNLQRHGGDAAWFHDTDAATEIDSWRQKMEAEPDLHEKIVLHRGWHTEGDKKTKHRPLENTYIAYEQAIEVGVRRAECDVWGTSDGEMVLAHDYNFRRMAEDEDSPLATNAIRDLKWDEIRDLKLKDGQTPVLASTVLEMMSGTNTKLVVEFKAVAPAEGFAVLLKERPELKDNVAFIFSFSLHALETYHMNGGPRDVTTMWLVDNPNGPEYPEESLVSGETKFDYAETTFARFAEEFASDDKENNIGHRLRKVGCGLYIQYNPKLTRAHILAIKQDYKALVGNEPAIGIWSDVGLDPEFDRAESLKQWSSVTTYLNTDFIAEFWEPKAEHPWERLFEEGYYRSRAAEPMRPLVALKEASVKAAHKAVAAIRGK